MNNLENYRLNERFDGTNAKLKEACNIALDIYPITRHRQWWQLRPRFYVGSDFIFTYTHEWTFGREWYVMVKGSNDWWTISDSSLCKKLEAKTNDKVFKQLIKEKNERDLFIGLLNKVTADKARLHALGK